MSFGLLGHVACPYCPHEQAHVKKDKGGFAYIACPDCGGQAFSRNEYRSSKLFARMKPVQISTDQPAPPAPAVQPAAPAAPVPPAKQPAAPKPRPVAKSQPEPAPAKPAAKSSGWFTPLLGG